MEDRLFLGGVRISIQVSEPSKNFPVFSSRTNATTFGRVDSGRRFLDHREANGMKFFLHVVKIGEFEWVNVVIIRSSRRNSTWSISIPLYKNFFVYVLSCRVMNECARFAHAWNTDDQETHRAHIPTRRVTDFATSRLQKIFGFTLNVNNKIFLFTNQLETSCAQEWKLFSSIKLEVAWSSLTPNFFVRLIAKRSWSTRLMHTLKISPRRIRNSTSRLAWSPIPPRANKKILLWHHHRVDCVNFSLSNFPNNFLVAIKRTSKNFERQNFPNRVIKNSLQLLKITSDSDLIRREKCNFTQSGWTFF